MRIALAALIAAGTLSAQADPRSPTDPALPRICELLRSGIETTEPSASIWRGRERRSVFDGSYDWHSSIAAHWAALCAARVEGDDELAGFVLGRLSPDALATERALLADLDAGSDRSQRQLAYFGPYADAWLTLLLAEIGRHEGRDTEALRTFRRETEDRVLAALEAWPFPERTPPADRGGKEFCGFYRSWLFGYLMLRLAGPTGEDPDRRLDALGREKLAPQRARLADYTDRHGFDFLHVAALHALVERVDPTVAEPVRFPAPEAFDPLPESVTLRTVHPVGVSVTELWPLAFDARRDPAAGRAYAARVEEILARTDLWADDFKVVSHWVPQFLWMAIWLERGRP